MASAGRNLTDGYATTVNLRYVVSMSAKSACLAENKKIVDNQFIQLYNVVIMQLYYRKKGCDTYAEEVT